MKWDTETTTKEINRLYTLKAGMDLTPIKTKIASLPDIVPNNVTGSIQIQIEERVEK